MNETNRADWGGFGSIAALATVGAIACSSSNPAPVADAAPSDAIAVVESGSANGEVTLTVMNFLKWCSVTINGGAPSTAATMTASVASGSTATIVVTPASSSFTIGSDPWFGVTQNNGGAAPGMDNGSGTTETSTATVVVTANQCASVCCQEPGNSPTPCPATNPCP